MSVRVELTERPGGGTRVTVSSRFPSEDAMQQILEMGAEEGMRQAMGQMDGLLRRAA